MLCDRLIEAVWYPDEWLETRRPHSEEVPHPDVPDLAVVQQKLASGEIGPETVRDYEAKAAENAASLRRSKRAISDYLDIVRSCDGKRAFRVAIGSIPESEYPRFREFLFASQRFHLAPDFADATLTRLATPETLEKSKAHFRLPHNPVWLEWYHSGEISDLKFGALLWNLPNDTVGGYFVYMLSDVRHVIMHVEYRTFDPASLRRVESKGELTVWMPDGSEAANDDFTGCLAFAVTDFLIRINSPRITNLRDGEDLTKLNRKRAKNGKPPLFSYHVVDLNDQVKAGLRLLDHAEAGDGKRRLHWRRGHFKCCRTGIFWWNPHLAGRADLGFVDKDYVA